MRIDRLDGHGINYKSAMRRFLNKEALYEKVLRKFLNDDAIDRLGEASEKGDSDAMAKTAHELKGMCGNLEIIDMFDACDSFMKLYRDENHTDSELNESYRAIVKCYKDAADAIKAALE